MNDITYISDEELHHIDRYLSGQLSPAEKEDFENRLSSDPDWAKKLQDIKLLSIGIQEVAVRKNLLALTKQNPVPSATPIRQVNWLKRLSVAAVLLIAVSSLAWLLFFRPTVDEKLFATYYRPDTGLPTEMGVSGNYVFERAMVDYKRADYKAAIAGWNSLLQTTPGSDTLNYFIACAQMADHNAGAAKTGFDAVLQQPLSVFAKDAYWYKGLLLLKEGKEKEAIADIQRSAHPQKAALLRKLKE